MRKFRLELHTDKIRLVEFGRYAADNRQRRGQGKPEAFAFLGFMHICGCGKTLSGRLTVLWQKIRQRLQARLGAIKPNSMAHAPTRPGGGQPAGR